MTPFFTQGCGKTVVVKQFADMLGYHIEPIMLYQVSCLSALEMTENMFFFLWVSPCQTLKLVYLYVVLLSVYILFPPLFILCALSFITFSEDYFIKTILLEWFAFCFALWTLCMSDSSYILSYFFRIWLQETYFSKEPPCQMVILCGGQHPSWQQQ